MRYLLCRLVSLILVLGCYAGPLGPVASKNSSGGYVLKIRRTKSWLLSRDANDTRIFDPTHTMAELKGLLGKYAQAAQFLDGVDLNPDGHPEDSYGPFTHPFIGALNATNTTVTNSTASTNATTPRTNGTANTSVLEAPQAYVRPLMDETSDPTPVAHFPGTAQMALTDYMIGDLDDLYYGSLQFGSQQQSLTVDIDTGSADLWVPVRCPSCGGDSFQASQSTSYHSLGRKFSVSYGAGRVSGILAQDLVSFGSFSVAQQAFGAVRSESMDFDDEPTDGLLGLAFGSISQSKSPTFFENLMATKQLVAGAFAVHLERGNANGGELCLGCFDTTKATGFITWNEVISRTYWSLALEALSINQWQDIPVNLTAAIDTGTSLIYVPDDVADSFYALIPGSRQAAEYGPGFYAYPCNTTLAVGLTFGNRVYSVDNADFNIGRISADSPDCIGGILGLGQGLPNNLAIIGDEFLKSWYSIYDYPGNRVGFAMSVNQRGSS